MNTLYFVLLLFNPLLPDRMKCAIYFFNGFWKKNVVHSVPKADGQVDHVEHHVRQEVLAIIELALFMYPQFLH